SRSPRFGIMGALVSTSVVIVAWGEHSNAIYWAFQAGFAFLLLHSLRWVDAEQAGASGLRTGAALLWVAHAFLWMRLGGMAWMACTMAALVLGTYFVFRL